MVVISMTIGLIILSYLVMKGTTNVEPDKNEEQEHAENIGAVKHQGWQTLDWQF